MSFPARIKTYLLQKLIRDPAGYGRPVPKEVFDQEYRSGAWDHFFGFAELPRHLVLAGLIRHLSVEQPAVLDLGCGSGRLASLYAAHPFSRYLGVDVSGEAIVRARALGLPRMEFAEGNYETWRPDGQFDAIVFNECIGYARDPAATLAAFIPYLRPRGSFFLSHFRFGNYRAQWRRLATVCAVTHATAVMSADGRQVWDLKVLQPRKATAPGR